MDTASLSSLITAAVSVGVVHTLAGPDHYVPLTALGRQRGWSAGEAARVTAWCGLAHCAASFVLVLGVLAALGGLGALETVRAWRGDLAAMLLIGLGLAMAVAALRRARCAELRRRPPPRTGGPFPWVLFLVFVLGPCEWLVPVATAAAAQHGLAGATLVAGAFCVATTAAMVGAVLVGSAIAGRVRLATPRGALPGASTALCGGLMLLGL